MNEQDLSQVCAVLETVMRLLRERVIGVYHYGPGVLGELRPASDLDLFVILSGTTLLDERRALVSEIMRISARPRDVASGRPIDVTNDLPGRTPAMAAETAS